MACFACGTGAPPGEAGAAGRVEAAASAVAENAPASETARELDGLSGEEILELHLEALGGREALAAIEDWVVDQELSVGNQVGRVRAKAMRPTYRRILTEIGGQTTIVGTDGEDAWKVQDGVRVPVSAEERRGMIVGAAFEPLEDPAAAGFVAIEREDDVVHETEQGPRPHVVVRLERASGSPLEHHFDAETLLLSEIRSTSPHPSLGELVVRTLYSDWREVDGVQRAHRVRQVHPFGDSRARVVSVEQNVGLSSEDFEPPLPFPEEASGG